MGKRKSKLADNRIVQVKPFSRYKVTPLSDARMTSKRAEERARRALEREAWRRENGYD